MCLNVILFSLSRSCTSKSFLAYKIQIFHLSGLECECTTYECLLEGTRTCTASHACYSQMTNIIERGCIDRKTPLLCENQRPKKKKIAKLMAGWPVLHCCRNRDLCNQGVIPTEPPDLKGWWNIVAVLDNDWLIG